MHPESYEAAKKLLELFGYTAEDIKERRIADLPQKVRAYGEEKVASEIGSDAPTLRDIVSEIVKPGRDIRESFPTPILRRDIMDIKDLMPGMELIGTVRNVVDFGAFVDIGVHQDGLSASFGDHRPLYPPSVRRIGSGADGPRSGSRTSTSRKTASA